MTDVTLSICLATFKRAAFIAQTLETIIPQLEPGMELVIVDGASPDATPDIVAGFAADVPQLRYYREETNSGVDADYDKAVGYARGEYVWLMTDDDLLKPGAVRRVLDLIRAEKPEMIVLDSEILDATCSHLLQARRLSFSGIRRYGPDESDALMRDAGDALSFIGGTILRRDTWLARDRQRYFGTLFIHVGVIFQAPIDRAVVVGEPLIQIRFGNAMWTARGFEIWMFLWPELIWSFSHISASAKAVVTAREPWRIPRKLLGFRANGSYSMVEYRKFFSGRRVGASRLGLLAFATLPGHVANLVAMSLLLAMSGRYRAACYALAWNSRFSLKIGRAMAALSWRRHAA